MLLQKSLCAQLARKYPDHHCSVEMEVYWEADAKVFKEAWSVYVSDVAVDTNLAKNEAIAMVDELAK